MLRIKYFYSKFLDCLKKLLELGRPDSACGHLRHMARVSVVLVSQAGAWSPFGGN